MSDHREIIARALYPEIRFVIRVGENRTPADARSAAAWKKAGEIEADIEKRGLCIEGGWQPIETAPKDGRWILGFIEDGGDPRIRTMWMLFWDAKHEVWSQGSWGFEPTYWRPMPAAPK